MQARDLHMTRGWTPGELEADCPCPKEPCGAISTLRADQNCAQHGPRFTRTMRHIHGADVCPVANVRGDYTLTMTVRGVYPYEATELHEHIVDYAEGAMGFDVKVQLRHGGC